jgi:ribosome modulation factor
MPQKTDYQKALERAYQAGYQAGAGEQNAFLSHLQTTNYHLWQELLELDQITPVNGVLLSQKLAKKLYNALPNKRLGIAIQFKRQIKLTEQHEKRILQILRSYKAEK